MIKKLKDIIPGEIFSFGGYEWVKLKQEGLVLTKDIVVSREFDEKSNDFNMANIKGYLTYDFYDSLASNGVCGDNFELVKLDFTADDGTRPLPFNYVSFIALLTADLYRDNRHLLPPLKSSWWLATPESYLKNLTSSVLVVNSYGTITTECADYSKCGVRPLCKLSNETEVKVDSPVNDTEADDITELIKKWAIDRGLQSGNPKAQMLELLKELIELVNNINKLGVGQIMESIGGIYVELVVFCMQLGLDINDCIKAAYEEIKDRKGKLVNGISSKREICNEKIIKESD